MQHGSIQKRHGAWTLLYYDYVIRAGQKKRVLVSRKLAPVSEEHPTKASVRELAQVILGPINRKQIQPESSVKLTEFIEEHYFPAIETELRPSTVLNYRESIYRPHLKRRLEKLALRVRDFRTIHGQRLLRDIHKNSQIGHRTLLHIKNFLSGVFKFARREGVLDSTNPMVDVATPGRLKKFKGAVYTLNHVSRMLEDIEAAGEISKNVQAHVTAYDLILLLSLTGLRQSECRGLRWSDWDEQNQTLMIQRSVWRRSVGPTKNPASEDTVPVLPMLRELLLRRRERIKPRPDDYIFAGERRAAPLNLHNLERRIIRPALEMSKLLKFENGRWVSNPDSGVQWFGFHGFRRGLASNLFDLGVNPKVIAAILRHGDIGRTLQYYVQTPDSESRLALAKLEEKIRNAPFGVLMNGKGIGSSDSQNVSRNISHRKGSSVSD